ncbi:unnamed protein product [Leuciscus chuanchicus]
MLTTDASLTGWGAILEGRSTQGLWRDHHLSWHIIRLEMLPIFLALKNFLSGSYSLRAAYVPGAQNIGADILSRVRAEARGMDTPLKWGGADMEGVRPGTSGFGCVSRDISLSTLVFPLASSSSAAKVQMWPDDIQKRYHKMYRLMDHNCSTVAAETVDDIIAKKLLVPCSTRWNLFYDALARIGEIPMAELNTVSSKFGMIAITEGEHQFIMVYCTVIRPLTVALDILQGEDNCFHGTLLPTLETLIFKTLELKSGLQILVDLPKAVVMIIKTRFAEVLESKDAVLAAVTLPKFKLRWLRTQDRKDKAKASLLAECRKLVLDRDQQAGTSTSTRHRSRDSAIEDELFSFDDEDDTSSTAESQVADYFKSGAEEIDSLNGFAWIKKNLLRYIAATPSSAPVERLFSLGKLVITPKRNRLSGPVV